MSGSDWGRHLKSCCKTPLGSMAVSTAWQISHGPATSSNTGVWNVRCHIGVYQELKKWENVIFTIRVLSRPTAVLTWAASLGWTFAVTCCNIYREYHVPVLVVLEFLHHVRTYIDIARLITQIVSYETNQIQFSSCGRPFLLNYVLFCLTCNSRIMHILPLPPCGLYSICAQNGYGQHRPCKIVLLTLVTPRGVTDFSWGINIEHARTAYHKTCGTEYQQPYRRCNSQTPYFNWNTAQARPMSVSDVSRSLQSWVLTTHRSYSQLTFFNFSFYTTLLECLRKYVLKNLLLQKLSRRQYLRYIF